MQLLVQKKQSKFIQIFPITQSFLGWELFCVEKKKSLLKLLLDPTKRVEIAVCGSPVSFFPLI